MSETNASTCPRCSATLPADARFCPRCGEQVMHDETIELPVDPALELARTEEREFPQAVSARPAPSLHRAERRPLGMTPLPFLGGLTIGALVLAIVLLAFVGDIPGVGLLVVTLVLAGLFATGVRRQPESSTAQLMAGLQSRMHDLAGYLASCGRTWSRTGAGVVSLRWRRLRLQRELRQRLRPLGQAVHEGDGERTEALKSEAAALQRELDELGHREAALVSSAQSEIERERVPVQPTEVFAPVNPPGESVPDRRTGVGA